MRGLALWREWDSTLDVPRRFAPELNDIKRSDLAGMSREQLEELAWRLHELARLLANRAGEDSSTSSRPPSSDDPYRREERGKPVAADPDGAAADSSDTAPEKAGKPDQNKTAKGSGKQPGAKGHWRCQPIVVSGEVTHAPMVCAACGAALGPDLKRRCVSAHDSLELVRGDMALQVTATRHSYFSVRCPCGHDNVERPRVGLSSLIEGRKRNLRMSERCLVGPMLATFIAALSLRCRLSRRKIQEFLRDWLDLELGVATIERCIHEFGLASEPVVERLIEDVRAAEIVRQRCLAHLIRKALALAEGYYGAGSGFGRDLVRDLRRLIGRVHDGADADALERLTNRIKWNCQCNRHEIEKKVRDLAGEILNDWDAVIAFVSDPNLPPTNNDAERALRHAVIARRISFGTRTDEGSRFYAAGLSVIDTCRRRGVEPWAYACSLIAAARANLTLPIIPANPAA